MQLGLAIIFRVLSFALKGLTCYCRKRSSASTRSREIGIVAQKQLSNLNAVMVDFHKAQCFFTIAINIAAVKVSVSSDANVGNFQMLYKTHTFLQTIAIGSYLPITFTLLNLHLVNKTFWYLAILSLISLTFGATSLGILSAFKVTAAQGEQLNHAFQEGGPRECSVKQPWVYCDVQYNQVPRYPYAWGIGILGACESIILIIILDKLNVWRKCSKRLWKSDKAASKLSGNATKTQPVSLLCEVLRFGSGVVLIGVLCWLLVVHMGFLKMFANLKDSNNNWGFGQVVALLVWVPCLCEWAYLGVCKLFQMPTLLQMKTFWTLGTSGGGKEGRRYQLIEPYKIIDTSELDHGQQVSVNHNDDAIRAWLLTTAKYANRKSESSRVQERKTDISRV